MKTLIIIDMQNDFITGSLANKDAEAIIPGIVNYIKSFDGNIILTRDTHFKDYLSTQEGQYLPVEHCIYKTEGWEVHNDIKEALRTKQFDYVDKNTFGYPNWGSAYIYESDEVILVGTCTDICVVSNALILKATYPNLKVTVLSDLCAGTTKENHEAALKVMGTCQCQVI